MSGIMMDTQQKARVLDLLSKSPPYSAAGPEERKALAGASALTRFKAGQVIFSEGERAEAGWLVVSGSVRIISFLEGARSFQLETVKPGDAFGLYCRIGGAIERYLCTAAAQVATTVLKIPDASFLPVYRRSASVARSTCDQCSKRLRRMRALSSIGRRGATARLAEVLLTLREEFGPVIPATRLSLSLWVGTTQETVFRILAPWRRAGAVVTERGFIRILDASALRAAMSEEA